MANRQAIIDRLIKNSAEVITEDELKSRLNSGEQLTHYIGFEISGYVHIGQGILSALVMKDLTDLGVKCTVWLADWHTAINDKLDGTRETAAKIGKGYFTEALKACLVAVGVDLRLIEFRLASDWYQKDGLYYQSLVVKISQNVTLGRMKRSISIMGRSEKESVDMAKLTYPAMQVADIFYQNIDIAHAGMDQRKAHVIMRDVADSVRSFFPDKIKSKDKPIALHHPLLIGLQKPPQESTEKSDEEETAIAMKMSKSKPDSAVWVHDSEAEIERKIKKAFCPEKIVENNPILNWAKHLLFWNRTEPFKIDRKPEHGGGVEFTDFASLEKAYAAGEIHPMDLKAAVAKELIALLQPVRDHFAKPEIAAHKAELDKVFQQKSRA